MRRNTVCTVLIAVIAITVFTDCQKEHIGPQAVPNTIAYFAAPAMNGRLPVNTSAYATPIEVEFVSTEVANQVARVELQWTSIVTEVSPKAVWVLDPGGPSLRIIAGKEIPIWRTFAIAAPKDELRPLKAVSAMTHGLVADPRVQGDIQLRVRTVFHDGESVYTPAITVSVDRTPCVDGCMPDQVLGTHDPSLNMFIAYHQYSEGEL